MSTPNDELHLISYESESTNDVGDVIPGKEIRQTVLCTVKSVNRSEFYSAARNGMRPEAVFEVNKYDYNKEKIVEHDGQRYDVIRDFMPYGKADLESFERIELVCQGVDYSGPSESE